MDYENILPKDRVKQIKKYEQQSSLFIISIALFLILSLIAGFYLNDLDYKYCETQDLVSTDICLKAHGF